MRIPHLRPTRTTFALTIVSSVALLLAVLAGGLVSGGATPTLASEPSLARQQQGGQFPDFPTWRPAVIFNDGLESTTFTVFRNDVAPEETLWISGEGVLVPDSEQPIGGETVHQDLIRLYDDGTNGDTAANDSFYSRSGITATGALTHDGGTHQALAVRLVFFTNTANGTQHSFVTMPNSPVGIVDTAQRGAIAAFQISSSVSATSHALFLQDDGTLFPTYPNVDEDLIVDAFDGCVACDVLVGQFGDQFDLISLQVSERLPSKGASDFVAFNKSVTNDAEGIGREIFNNNQFPDSVTGSAGRLRAIIWENEIDIAAFTHEVFHTWGVSIGLDAGFNEGTGHFGPNNTLNGVIDVELADAGGSALVRDEKLTDLVANGDGTHRVVARPGEYNATLSPLSLYLAGLIPPAQVTDWDVLANPDFSDLDRVTASSVTTFSIDDVIATYGPRIPAAGDAPTDFRLGVVVFKDRPFTEADYAFSTLALRYFESSKTYDGTGAPPWKSATLGLGTVNVALPAFGGTPIDFSGAPGDDTATPPSDDIVIPPDDTTTPPDDVETEPDDTVALPPALTTRSVIINPGWNLVGWSGAQTDTSLALAAIVDRIRNVFAWDPLFGTFYSYSPLAPSFLNDLTFLATGDGLWLFSTGNGPIEWEVPIAVDGLADPSVSLAAGSNLTTWLGADGASITAAIAGLGNAFISLQTWDPLAERFLIYAAGVPTFVNEISTLFFGDAVWITVSRAVDWIQTP